jgi:transposase
MRYMFTDELWAMLAPRVDEAKRYKCGAEPELPERMFFEAVLYWARTGVPWRDLPSEFGAWDAVYNRFRRWIASGSLAKLFELLTAEPEFEEVKRVLVDATNVRAHRHAAGASKKRGQRRIRDSVGVGAASPAKSY